MNPIHHAVEKSMHGLNVSKLDRLFLGVSGGIDSMVMLDVLFKLKFNITVAHVNFQLRGTDADEDALLVKAWCINNKVPFLLLAADTKKIAAEEHLNTQLAARKIRYDWWDVLKQEKKFDFLATAHHLDDQVETFFINLLRGTGMKGLQGIPYQRDYFIRPMLDITRSEIETYASENKVSFRTDASNLSDDYQRNRIRHHLIPLLNGMTPGFQSRMKHTLTRLQKEWKAWEGSYQTWVTQSVLTLTDFYEIRHQPGSNGFLLRWLEEKGIPWNLVLDYVESQTDNSGSVLQYKEYRLSRTPFGFVLEKIKPAQTLWIDKPGTYISENLVFTILPSAAEDLEWTSNSSDEIISATAVTFPLRLRPVEPGDSFQPLGMEGKQRKIQDLLVDRKLSMHEKSKVRVLANERHIIWVLGIQLDERAKVNAGESKRYRLAFSRL